MLPFRPDSRRASRTGGTLPATLLLFFAFAAKLVHAVETQGSEQVSFDASSPARTDRRGGQSKSLGCSGDPVEVSRFRIVKPAKERLELSDFGESGVSGGNPYREVEADEGTSVILNESSNRGNQVHMVFETIWGIRGVATICTEFSFGEPTLAGSGAPICVVNVSWLFHSQSLILSIRIEWWNSHFTASWSQAYSVC